MGTFLELKSKKESSEILRGREQEFKDKLRFLLNAGGMLGLDYIKMHGKEITTLKPVSFDQNGNMNFYYNYFEDDSWESAGFSSQYNMVYSNKVGWSEFNFVVFSAYILEALFLDEKAVVLINDSPDFLYEKYAIGWINYLFDMKYPLLNGDRWETFLMCYDRNDDIKYLHFDYEIEKYYGMYPIISKYEVFAMQYGMDKTIEKMISDEEIHNDTDELKNALIKMKEIVDKYKSLNNNENSYRILIEQVKLFNKNIDEPIAINLDDKLLTYFYITLYLINSVVLTIKIVSEVYDIDFWKLYDEIGNIKRKEGNDIQRLRQPILKIDTALILNIDKDDMIYYWKKDNNIKFSKEINNWFNKLSLDFENIFKEDFDIINPVDWVLNILEFSHENYYSILTFSDFFDETISNINDKKYLTLWKLFDDMCHDSTMLENGKVIFDLSSSQRRFTTSWDIMSRDKKFNSSRKQLRRYMALVANKELRKVVFGF